MKAHVVRGSDGALRAISDTGAFLGLVVEESAMRPVDRDEPIPAWLRFAWALGVLLVVAYFAFQVGRLYAVAHPT